jgi:hypothetical protein
LSVRTNSEADPVLADAAAEPADAADAAAEPAESEADKDRIAIAQVASLRIAGPPGFRTY